MNSKSGVNQFEPESIAPLELAKEIVDLLMRHDRHTARAAYEIAGHLLSYQLILNLGIDDGKVQTKVSQT